MDKHIKVSFTISIIRLVERLIFLSLLIYLYNNYTNYSNKLSEIEKINKIENDSLKFYKDKFGQLQAKINVIETQKIETLLKYETTNSNLKKLQLLVKRNQKLLQKKGSASVIQSETVVDTTTTTTVSYDNSYPVYSSHIKNKWYQDSIVATKDSIYRHYKTFSELNLIIGNKRKGLFGRSKLFAVANDKNPYTNIKDMKIYNVIDNTKKRKLHLGLYTGYGLSIINNRIYTGFQIGGGLNYILW